MRVLSSTRLPPAPRAAPPSARPSHARAAPGCARRPPLRPVAARGAPGPDRATLYETLGVAVGASAEAVKRAYRRLALRHHPDVSRTPDAPSRFQEIRQAYEGLLMGGGEQQRPWWRARWLEQLRGLPSRIREKLAHKRARRAAAAAAAVQPELSAAERAALDAADAELRRQRLAEQLSGLQQRAARKTRRRKPPAGSTSSDDNW